MSRAESLRCNNGLASFARTCAVMATKAALQAKEKVMQDEIENFKKLQKGL